MDSGFSAMRRPGMTNLLRKLSIERTRALRRDALRRLGHGGERAVSLSYVELDTAGAADIRAGYFGHAMLEAFRHRDLDAMRRAGDRVLDRLVLGFEHAGDRHFGA